VHCRLEAQQKEITTLRESLGNHAGELASLKSVVNELSTKLSDVLKPIPCDNLSLARSEAPSDHQPPQGAITYSQALSGPSRLSSATTAAKIKLNRKSNLVIFGVAEHPSGTPRHTRTLKDLSAISGILSKLSSSISEQSIKDCFRLGKFKEGRTRPILVKMLRICDVSSVLASRRNLSSVAPNISIKPDLSLEARRIEHVLLKERRELINSGGDKESIKLRGTILFKENQRYGEVINNGSAFQLCTPAVSRVDHPDESSLPTVSLTNSSEPVQASLSSPDLSVPLTPTSADPVPGRLPSHDPSQPPALGNVGLARCATDQVKDILNPTDVQSNSLRLT